MPPDMLVRVGGRRFSASGMPTRRNSSAARAQAWALSDRHVELEDLGDLFPDAEDRVQAGLRLLEDHRGCGSRASQVIARCIESRTLVPAKCARSTDDPA